MNRRDALKAGLAALSALRAHAAGTSVSTLIGTGSPGFSDREVNNPYGLVIGPDRALYFCDWTISGFAASTWFRVRPARSPATAGRPTAAMAVRRRRHR